MPNLQRSLSFCNPQPVQHLFMQQSPSSHKHLLFAGQNHTYRENRMPLFFSPFWPDTESHLYMPFIRVSLCSSVVALRLADCLRPINTNAIGDLPMAFFVLSPFDIVSHSIVDNRTNSVTLLQMIISFKHKGLIELFERGISRRVRSDLQRRCLRRLEVLDQANSLTDLNIPGFNFHGLQGVPKRYSIHVNGPWCITFEWREGDALRVDLEQYH